jgi:hypothetical protein
LLPQIAGRCSQRCGTRAARGLGQYRAQGRRGRPDRRCRPGHAVDDAPVRWPAQRPALAPRRRAAGSGSARPCGRSWTRPGCCRRTVRRYVDHLIDLDVPVESVRGRYGGYQLGPGYRLPPLMLTDDEALAVLLGLAIGRRAGWLAGTGTASETAVAKIRRVLPERLARRLDALLGSLAFTARPPRQPLRTARCCCPSPMRCATTGRSRSGTPPATAVAANAPCTPVVSSSTHAAGTSPVRIPGSARTGPSGSTASPARGRCPARSSRPPESIRHSTSCMGSPTPPTGIA